MSLTDGPCILISNETKGHFSKGKLLSCRSNVLISNR